MTHSAAHLKRMKAKTGILITVLGSRRTPTKNYNLIYFPLLSTTSAISSLYILVILFCFSHIMLVITFIVWPCIPLLSVYWYVFYSIPSVPLPFYLYLHCTHCCILMGFFVLKNALGGSIMLFSYSQKTHTHNKTKQNIKSHLPESKTWLFSKRIFETLVILALIFLGKSCFCFMLIWKLCQ